MSLLKSIIGAVISWLIISLLLISLLLIPYDNQNIPGGENRPLYDWDLHQAKIEEYFTNVFVEGTLGNAINIHSGMETTNAISKFLIDQVPRSLGLLAIAFVLSIFLGVKKGIYDYRTNKKKRKVFGTGSTWFVLATPDFILITTIQFTLIYLIINKYIPDFIMFDSSEWYTFILPSILLSIIPTFYLAEIISTSLQSQEKQLYIRTAFAKGLRQKQVISQHALKNSWLILVSNLQTIGTILISNLIIVEYLTNYHGGAYLLYEALGGANFTIDPYLIIPLITIFTLIMLGLRIMSLVIRYYIDPLWREGQ